VIASLPTSCSWIPAFAGMTEGNTLRGKWIEAEESDRQIVPSGVRFLDQADLPVALPAFDPFLPHDGCFDVVMRFEPDEALDAIVAGEAGDEAFTMMVDAGGQIRCDAGVEGAVLAARKDVYEATHAFELPVSSSRRKPGPKVDVAGEWCAGFSLISQASCSWVPAFAGMTGGVRC
jgi:hypothetical protein